MAIFNYLKQRRKQLKADQRWRRWTLRWSDYPLSCWPVLPFPWESFEESLTGDRSALPHTDPSRLAEQQRSIEQWTDRLFDPNSIILTLAAIVIFEVLPTLFSMDLVQEGEWPLASSLSYLLLLCSHRLPADTVRSVYSWLNWPQSAGDAEIPNIALHFIILHFIVLHCTVLYCSVLYCMLLYFILLYCIASYYIVLYCLVLYLLYCIALYCIESP